MDCSNSKNLERPTQINQTNQLPVSISSVLKSLCKIETQYKKSSGFLIKFEAKEDEFYCLLTNEHIITKDLVEKKGIIKFIFECGTKEKEIKLDDKERYIKVFMDINIDAIVIQILPKDEIEKDYFLSFDKNYINDFNKLKNEDITIIQNLSDCPCYSYGKIKEINKYEFTYSAFIKNCLSGSPIFLKGSKRVIGIHKYGNNSNNYGDFIGPIFDYFKKNEIILYKNISINNNGKKEYDSTNSSMINKLNQITIIYQIKQDEEKIQLFGSHFVQNNENNCYLLIDGQRQELCTYLKLNQHHKEKNTLEIKLIESKSITNLSNMFHSERYYSSLKSVRDISDWETKIIFDMSEMFDGCESLKSLPDISKWNTKKVTNMSGMFYNCESLKSLPDISKWDTKKVTNMSKMFLGCKSLISLPDISKWDTKKVNDMSNMFCSCESLITLPDISKWDTKNVKDMSFMFGNCESLGLLPDISNWNTKYVTDIHYMFFNCRSLKYLPDISKWDIKNVTHISNISCIQF